MTRRNRSIAVLATSLCLPLSLGGAASADPIGDTKSDLFPPAASLKRGDTPAEFGKSIPAPVVRGDTPAEFGRPTPVSPTRIEIVRPERTIVREVDEAPPIILASLALLVALAGLGVAVTRNNAGMRLSRSH